MSRSAVVPRWASGTWWWRCRAGVAALLLVAGGAAAEESTPAAQQALQALLGSLAEGETFVAPAASPAKAPPAAPAAVPVRQKVVARAGETLDAVVRRLLTQIPIKDNVLRSAFIEVNPEVFAQGVQARFRTRTELWVPSPDDVRRLVLRDTLAPTAAAPAPSRTVPAPPTPTAPPLAAAAPPPPPPVPEETASAEPTVDHTGWVRFP